MDENETVVPLSVNDSSTPSSRTSGWVAGAQRQVETWSSPSGTLLRVAGGSDFFLSPDGQEIRSPSLEKNAQELNEVDRQILLGPVMVLALALRDTWSLHASAVIFKKRLIVILGESGQGKSTLGAYLGQSPGWRLAADDILPVTLDANGLNALPHFPQLKIPPSAQPGIHLPEQIPLSHLCVLASASPDQMPALQKLPAAQVAQSLLSHMAGARMFNETLLAKHLAFAAQAAGQISAYQLVHPHRRDTLPLVREFLETIQP